MVDRWSAADVALIRELNLLESVVSGYVELAPSGPANLAGRCPFHQDRLRSLSVRQVHQSFHCFGCGAGGDVIAFAMRAQALSRSEALRHLADRIGHRPTRGDPRRR